jgi:hypothetical protein
MTSHTYKLYAYDPRMRKMLLYNRGDTFVFDPARCDWERERVPTPFGGGWWVPHFCTTQEGVVVWAPRNGGGRDAPGLLWRFNAEKRAWEEIKTAGGPLPGTPSDDWGTVVHDAKRKQLLLFSFAGDPRGGKTPSVVWSCDLATGALRKLEPANARQGAKFPREAVYLPAADLVLFADLRKDLGAGRIAATVYDVEGNRFRGLEMALPAGKGKPAYGDVGCGLMYDPGRELVWAVYPFWDLQAMRFDPKSAKLTDD